MLQNLKNSKLALAIICIIAATSAHSKCVVKGCFNEICACEEETVISLCLWKAANSCYRKFGICEANEHGCCEWRTTNELQTCVKNIDARVDSIDTFSD